MTDQTATPGARPPPARDAWALGALVARESLRSFGANRSLESAAMLAYYGFLSLMPLLLLVIFLGGMVARSSEAALEGLRALMTDLFPAFNEDILRELLLIAQQKVWGAVGVIVLLWSMTPFAAAARNAVTRVFKAERKLAFLKGKLVDVAAVLSLLLLFLALVAVKLYLLRAGDDTGAAWHASALRAGAVFAATAGVLAFSYAAFAPVRLRPAELLAGAVTATVLLSVIRPLFGVVLQYNPNFGYAFGSLKAIFLLIVWVYYTFAVLLFGAEVAANTRRREALVLRGFFLEGRKPSGTLHRLLARFVRSCDAGTELFREGDAGHEMFYVLAGAVRLTRGGQELRVMREGDYFGEMSMLVHAPRSATAAAVEPDTQLVAISEGNFDTILRENPAIVRRILAEMAGRLQAMNERLTPPSRG